MLLYFLLLLRVVSWFESRKNMIKPYHYKFTCLIWTFVLISMVVVNENWPSVFCIGARTRGPWLRWLRSGVLLLDKQTCFQWFGGVWAIFEFLDI